MMCNRFLVILGVFVYVVGFACSWSNNNNNMIISSRSKMMKSSSSSSSSPSSLYVVIPQKENVPIVISTDNNNNSKESSSSSSSSSSSVAEETTTEKYGLEVGLFQSLQKDDGGESAKSLLKKYGIAYLATSIPLAIVSFGICYVLVDNGVDVSALLAKVGIENAATAEKAGTFAIAYAAHKAASPIRFPPTVVLTPIVAKLIGKEPNQQQQEEEEQQQP